MTRSTRRAAAALYCLLCSQLAHMREARGLFHFAPVVKFSFVLVCLNNKLCNHLYVACFQVYISGDLARGAHSMHSPHRRHTAQSAASTASTKAVPLAQHPPLHVPAPAILYTRSTHAVHSQYTRSTLAVKYTATLATRVENFSTGCNAATTHENSARKFSRLNYAVSQSLQLADILD